MSRSTAMTLTDVGRLVTVVGVITIIAALGWALFVWYPDGNFTVFLGVLATILLATLGLKIGGSLAESVFSPYNVANVDVEGPITRGGGGGLPTTPGGSSADDIVEVIEQADADTAVEALVVHLNTPGGEVVPSDDIRRAAAEFDGTTVAYATDTCASGGYWIASGCDRIVAREGSLVGSIGVLGSRPNMKGLADRLDIEYEQLTAGEYKNAGNPLKEFTEQDREYLQGIVDGYYDTFIERVSDGRELDESTIRETEARVYLGPEAEEYGLVDNIGTMDDVEAYMESELGTSVTVRTFEPNRGLTERVGFGAQRIAAAVGAGVAGLFLKGDGTGLEFR